MKKIVLAMLLAVILTAGVFADHPDGWGVGVVFGPSLGSWDGFSGSSSMGRVALSLKAPQLPIYWAINLRFGDDVFGLGASGDYYLIDQRLIPDINFGWYLGLGGYVAFAKAKNSDGAFELGARLPIGLYIMPIDILDIFIAIVPCLGLQVAPKVDFPAGGLGAEFGIRIWF